MTGRARLFAIALAAPIILFASAGTAQHSGKTMDEAERLIGTVWLAEDIKGGDAIDSAKSTITIAPNGALSGSGGCNRLMGQAKVDRGQISFGPIATTRMACAPALMDQERKFLAALEATRAYRFDGARLRFYDASGVEVVRFKRMVKPAARRRIA